MKVTPPEWADSLAMIRERHPGGSNMTTGPVTPTLNAVAQSDFAVRGVQAFEPLVGKHCSMVRGPFRENVTSLN